VTLWCFREVIRYF